jgi:ribosomal protein S14
MGAEIEGRTREEAGGRTSAVVRAVLCLCRLPNELGHKLS